MQPTLVVSARVEGIVYLNGRFAGECAPDAPLFFPVARRGANYLEYRPIERGAKEIARKLVLSDGRPVSVPEDLFCVCWPCGAIEVEVLCGAEGARWGNIQLPPGTREPEETLTMEDGATLLLGAADGNRYAATVAEGGALNGFVRFSRFQGMDGNTFACVTDREDTVGHASLEQWRATADGLKLVSSESVWTHGAPRWPQTEEKTALAALEAALLGLAGEADGYLAPELRGKNILGALSTGASACGAVRFAAPDEHSAVALFYPEAPRLAVARCARFRCMPVSATQGPWQVMQMWLDPQEGASSAGNARV